MLKPVKLWEAGLKDLMHRCCVLALKAAISSSVKPSARTQDRFSVRLQDHCDYIQTDSAKNGCMGYAHGHHMAITTNICFCNLARGAQKSCNVDSNDLADELYLPDIARQVIL